MKKIILSILLLCISFTGTYADPIDANQDYSGIYFLQQGTKSVIVANGELSAVANSTLENAGFKGVWLIQKVENGYTVRDTESKLYASITSSGTNLSKEPVTVSTSLMSLQNNELTFNVQETDYKAVSAYVVPEKRNVDKLGYYYEYNHSPQNGDFLDKYYNFADCTDNIFYAIKNVSTLDYYISKDMDLVDTNQENFYGDQPDFPTYLFNFNNGSTVKVYYDHAYSYSNYKTAQCLASTEDDYLYPQEDKGGMTWAFNLNYLTDGIHYVDSSNPSAINYTWGSSSINEITDFTPYRYIIRPVKVDYAEHLAKIKEWYANLMKSYAPFVGNHAPSKLLKLSNSRTA